MSLTSELLDHISVNTSLTLGTDLFLVFIPNGIETGVTISESGGYEAESNMLRLLYKITSKGVDPLEAEAKCREVYNLLSFSNGIQLPSFLIFNSVPMATPQFLHMADDTYPVYIASFVLYTERT